MKKTFEEFYKYRYWIFFTTVFFVGLEIGVVIGLNAVNYG
ncbi:hypothetical protein JOD28_001771 [Leuconostoc rapi]|nr:hypothetical protein [Leuconostoc rapi]